MFNTLMLCEAMSEGTAKTIAIILEVVLAIILLVFTLKGFVSGFIDAILKLVSTVGALAVAIFCARPVTNFLDPIIHIGSWFSGLGAKLCSGDAFNEVVSSEEVRARVLDAINGSENMGFIKSFLTNVVNGIDLTKNVTALDAVSASIGMILGVVLTGVLLFLGVKLIVFLLGKLFDSVDDKRGGKSGLDRFLGSLLGLAKGMVIVVIVFIIGTFLSYAKLPVPQIMNNTVVAKHGYNIVAEKVEEVIDEIDFNALIDKLLKNGKTDDSGESTGGESTGGESTGGESSGSGESSGESGAGGESGESGGSTGTGSGEASA